VTPYMEKQRRRGQRGVEWVSTTLPNGGLSAVGGGKRKELRRPEGEVYFFLIFKGGCDLLSL